MIKEVVPLPTVHGWQGSGDRIASTRATANAALAGTTFIAQSGEVNNQ